MTAKTSGLHAEDGSLRVTQVDPSTGASVDPSEATLVEIQDSSPVAGSVTSAAVLFTADMDGYQSISVQTTSAGTSCTITYETCDDNSTWLAILGRSDVSASGQIATTSNALGILKFGKIGRYFRARVSSYGSGTVTVTGHMSSAPFVVRVETLSRLTASTSTSQCPTNNARIQSGASTNATSVKASSGVLNQVIVANNAAALAYLKFYNKASAPTVGTDVPVATIALPANGLPVVIALPTGISFSTGIAYAITGLATDADATAVLASQVTGIIGYS